MIKQTEQAEFLFLGTGASSGVPMVGCDCPVCTSTDPRNKRLRASGLLTIQGKKLLIDSGPDFRYQALRANISHLDGVLITHSHFDHTGGLDELRIYYIMHHTRLPILLSRKTFDDLKHRLDYLFSTQNTKVSLTAQLDVHLLEKEKGCISFLGIDIDHMEFDHAGVPVTGYRFGPLAYLSDIRNYPQTLFEQLAGIKILIVSALRDAPSMAHFTLDEAIAFAQKTDAEEIYFTHMGHELDYEETNAKLPKGIMLAYDGLKLDFKYGT